MCHQTAGANLSHTPTVTYLTGPVSNETKPYQFTDTLENQHKKYMFLPETKPKVLNSRRLRIDSVISEVVLLVVLLLAATAQRLRGRAAADVTVITPHLHITDFRPDWPTDNISPFCFNELLQNRSNSAWSSRTCVVSIHIL